MYKGSTDVQIYLKGDIELLVNFQLIELDQDYDFEYDFIAVDTSRDEFDEIKLSDEDLNQAKLVVDDYISKYHNELLLDLAEEEFLQYLDRCNDSNNGTGYLH